MDALSSPLHQAEQPIRQGVYPIFWGRDVKVSKGGGGDPMPLAEEIFESGVVLCDASLLGQQGGMGKGG